MEEQSLFSAAEFRELHKGKNKVKHKRAEENVQLAICKYLRDKYPADMIWFCDLASGMKMPLWLAARNKRMRSCRGLPDLFISESRGGFHGLYIELKKEGAVIFNKSGGPYDKHIKEQQDVLRRLRDKGYRAEFGIGYDQCVSIIDTYLSM